MPFDRTSPYEVVAGTPTWGRLYRLASEATAKLTHKAISLVSFNKGHKQNLNGKCQALDQLRHYLTSGNIKKNVKFLKNLQVFTQNQEKQGKLPFAEFPFHTNGEM